MGMKATHYALLLALASPAARAEEAPWPPPEVRERMRELQAEIQEPATSADARRAARFELLKLLRSPGAAPADPDKPRAARASVPPMPAQSPLPVAPPPPRMGPPPPTATLVPAPRAIPPVDAESGRVLVPSGRSAVTDPATGRVLQPAPGGYIDPGTGRFVPGR